MHYRQLNISMEPSNSTTTQQQLSLSDLIVLKQIVEVASERGAFKADELSHIGQLYDRLRAFLEQAVPQDSKENQSPGE